MGYKTAVELQEFLDYDIALHTHLTGNHYPLIPPALFLEPLKEAISACNEGDQDRSISLGEEVEWKGKHECSAYALVEFCHAWPWVDTEDY